MFTRKFIGLRALTALPLALGLMEGGPGVRAQNLKVESFRFSSVGFHYSVDLNSPKPRSFSFQGGAGGESVSTKAKPISAQFAIGGGFAQTKILFQYEGHLILEDFLNLPPFTLDKIPVQIRFYSGLDGSIVDEVVGQVGANGDFAVLTDANPAPLIDGISYPTEISLKASHWLRSHLTPTQPATPAGYDTRFLVLPWSRLPGLASHVLGKAAAVLSEQWQCLYQHPIYLLETFIDPGHFRGRCYRAANWIFLGLTTSRGKNDLTKKANRPLKELWVRPLVRDFRAKLGRAHG